jgi:hypothetical protein
MFTPIYKLRDWIDPDKLDYYFLSRNSNAIKILEKNLDKINWAYLSENPAAIHILEKNINKISWPGLFTNIAAIQIIENNLDKIDYDLVSENPSIFVLDKNAMKQQIMQYGFAEELIATVLHPSHFERNLELYNYDISIDEYLN